MAKNSPFSVFQEWFEQACELKIEYPNAMVLATTGKNHRPSSRIVLLKEWSPGGFVFYTNFTSRKGRDIEENPFASVLFHWEALEKQIRIEGRVEKIPVEKSEAYFQTRPKESRLGAWASRQSHKMADRQLFHQRLEEVKRRFPDEVPLPDFWGGYCLVPDYFEFWKSGAFRLHERLIFEKKADEWESSLLFP